MEEDRLETRKRPYQEDYEDRRMSFEEKRGMLLVFMLRKSAHFH